MENIKFRIPTAEQYEEVKKLFVKFFLPYEPISKVLKFTTANDGSVDKMGYFMDKALKENLSIVAIDRSTGKIIGAMVNGEAKRDDFSSPEAVEFFNELKENKVQLYHMIELIKNVYLKSKTNIFDEMDTDFLFDLKLVTVDEDWRKSGLMGEMVKRSIDLARILGFVGCKTEATGMFSRKSFLNLGLEIKSEYHYSDYEDEKGLKILADIEAPHTCLTLLTKKF